MNVHVNTSRYFKPAVELPRKRLQFSRVIRKYVRGAVRFVDALRAAQAVTRQAERYYAMSDSQLAGIGLTREDVPIELRHALERNQLG